MTHAANDTLWQKQAAQWSRIGSPLRPCAEDVANFRQGIGTHLGRCLLLGVTPELSSLSPSMSAIDNSEAMIRALWNNESSAIQGNWLDLPFGENSFETIVGDGCMTLLTYPSQYVTLSRQLNNVLSPQGKVALRLFVSPDVKEEPESVCHAALRGKINSFHAFKWRLSMALASMNEDHNVAVADTWAAFDRLFPDRNALAASTAWPMQDITTIDAYRHSTAIYSHPTLTQVRSVFSADFKETALLYGHYELAERCPILVLESRK
jgi:hypothetical protein